MNNYGGGPGYGGPSYGGYGGGGYGGYGGRGPGRGNGPTGGQVLFLIILLVCFAFWWYDGSGLQHHKKYTKEQAASQEKVLKQKANKDERLTSSEINNEVGQTEGTTNEQSYDTESLSSLKYNKSKDKYGYKNLGSSTFGEDQMWNAYNKENGGAWYSIFNEEDGHSYIQALITSKSVKDTQNSNTKVTITKENEPVGIEKNKKISKKETMYVESSLAPYQLLGAIGTLNQGQNELLTKKNLITLTSQAKGNSSYGLTYIEDKIRTYLQDGDNRSVFYTVDPVYDSNDRIPKGLHIMAQSFDPNSNEKPELNFNYYLFNVQNGYKINYQNASFSKE